MDLTAPDADAIHLEFDTPQGVRELELKREGDLWPIRASLSGQRFRVRVRRGQSINHVIHPYADGIWDLPWGQTPSTPYWQSFVDHRFDWGEDTPPRHAWNGSVIYECHIRNYTSQQGGGTYADLIDKLDYIKSLGVTAVELLPVWHFSETDNPRTNPDTGLPLNNVWGYQPLSFFALKGGYARDPNPQATADEFKSLVKAAHERELEVVLDVVFNHTGQIDNAFSQPGWDWLQQDVYLRRDRDILDFTGCGNTFGANSPQGANYIIESLKHWVDNYHIDGFRYDLAGTLYRGPQGELDPHPLVVRKIMNDPLLCRCKHMFEPWDIGHQITDHVPREIATWDDQFRDSVRRYINFGDDPQSVEWALRGDSKRISFIACHDGFTARDVVSYSNKHNHANGEHNTDGHDHNFASNHGSEGGDQDPALQARRLQQVKSMLLLNLLAPTTPLICAGDECFRTQFGNNNGYCLEGAAGEMDWHDVARHAELVNFTRTTLSIRRQHQSIISQGWRLVATSPELDQFQCGPLHLYRNKSDKIIRLPNEKNRLHLMDTSSLHRTHAKGQECRLMPSSTALRLDTASA